MNSHAKELKELLPQEGFIKLVNPKVSSLSSEQRIGLIRKGNEFFNSGNLEKAKRIFLTTGYSDGLIRVADKCLKNHDPFEALKLYKIAKAADKADALIEKMAFVLRRWISE